MLESSQIAGGFSVYVVQCNYDKASLYLQCLIWISCINFILHTCMHKGPEHPLKHIYPDFNHADAS